VSLVYPRRTLDDNIKSISEIRGADGVIGFDLNLKDGNDVMYRVAANGKGILKAGNLVVDGEALLIVKADGQMNGIILGCEGCSMSGRTINLSGDFEFAIDSSGLHTKPIYTPIAPIQILPDISIFTEQLDISMTCATPDVDIHYTLNGHEPNPDSPIYNGTITIADTALMQARAFRKGVKNNPSTYTGIESTQTTRARFTKEPFMKAKFPKDLSQGLSYKYYEGEWQKLLLFLDSMAPIKKGNVEHLLDISAKRNGNFYAFRYKGWFKANQDGVYTFYSPHPVYDPETPNLDPGYHLTVKVGEREWYPGTRRHGFGKWSVPLEKGFHSFEVIYLDFREGKEDIYFANKEYKCIWQGKKPEFLISGPGLDKLSIPQELLWSVSGK
jgi:hypothetical protein